MDVLKHTPTDSTRITSKFGYRTDPKTGLRSYHHGVDIGAKVVGVKGDPIYAVDDGVVAVSKHDGAGIGKGYGYYVIIQHNDFASLYAHMIKLEVKVGQFVKAGDIIGHMGLSGYTTGVHLHFEMRLGKYANKQYLNPENYLFAIKNTSGLDENIKILKDHAKISDGTVQYLLKYEYGEELIRKLATAIKGG